jgi:uncharacterized protein (DUF305 family)
VLVVLAGCSAGATAALLATRTPGEDSAESGFARDMMVHHAQAVQMAEIVRHKTQSDAIRLLAADVALTQQAQIGMMQGWLQVWGLPPTSTKPAMSWMGHPTEGLMPGMATPEEIDGLYDAPPEEADRLFLRLMILHHQAAIPMAEAILERTDRPEVRQLAEAIGMSQRAEIQTMEGMLRDLLGDSAKVELEPQSGSHALGSATFKEAGGGVRVELDLNALPKPNTFYLAHIHQGTCTAEGDVHEHSGAHGEEGYSHQHGESGHEHGAGAEIEYPLSQVKSDSEGHGSSTTTLRETTVEELFSGEPKRVVNVHEAGSGNPPILTCAELKETGWSTAE